MTQRRGAVIADICRLIAEHAQCRELLEPAIETMHVMSLKRRQQLVLALRHASYSLESSLASCLSLLTSFVSAPSIEIANGYLSELALRVFDARMRLQAAQKIGRAQGVLVSYASSFGDPQDFDIILGYSLGVQQPLVLAHLAQGVTAGGVKYSLYHMSSPEGVCDLLRGVNLSPEEHSPPLLSFWGTTQVHRTLRAIIVCGHVSAITPIRIIRFSLLVSGCRGQRCITKVCTTSASTHHTIGMNVPMESLNAPDDVHIAILTAAA